MEGAEDDKKLSFDEGFVLVNKAKLWVVDTRSPKGQDVKGVVCFVHGLHMDCTMWFEVMIRLWADGYRCIAYDLRGHGDSGQPWFGYSTEEQAGDLIAIVEKLELDDELVHLVGASMGGLIAARAAEMRPNLFASLVVMHAAVRSYPPMVRLTMAVHAFQTSVKFFRRKDDMHEMMFSQAYLKDGDPRKVRTVIEWRARLGALPLYASIMTRWGLGLVAKEMDWASLDMPVLFVTGSQDPVFPPSALRRMAEAAGPSTQVAVLPGLAHGSMIEDSKAVFQALADFFKKSVDGPGDGGQGADSTDAAAAEGVQPQES